MWRSSRFALSVLDALSTTIAVIDERGFIISVNKAWRDFAKANHPSPGSVCEGANYLAVCDAAQGPEAGRAAEFAAALRAIFRNERESFYLEYPCHSPQEQRWFVGRAKPFQFGRHSRLVISHHDITERKLAELKVSQSERRYRELFENSLVSISETTVDGEFIRVNLACARMYGYEDLETFNADVKNEVRFYSDPADRREVLRVLAEKAYLEPREILLKRRDGSIFPAMLAAREIRNEDDEFVEYQASHIDISALKSAEAELRASREQMRTLAYRAQKACEDERTNTARKIHDLLSQTLTRLKIDLVWLQRRLENPGNAAPVIPRVAEMAGMADEALSTVQRIATELRPAVLDSLGLCAALEWLARDFKDHCEIGCRAFVPEREPSIDRDTATAAFRIVQESLTNVYRHSSATAVEICLETEEDQIVLSIHDDGIGIDPKKFADPLSIGLAGMRERALLAGGSFDIRSRHSSGTIVEAHFPLQRSNGFPPGET